MRAAKPCPPLPRRPSSRPSTFFAWGYRAASTMIFTTSGDRAWASSTPCTPEPSRCSTIQKLPHMTVSLMPPNGSTAMTVGVRCPLFVGPPSTSPCMNARRSVMSNGLCSRL